MMSIGAMASRWQDRVQFDRSGIKAHTFFSESDALLQCQVTGRPTMPQITAKMYLAKVDNANVSGGAGQRTFIVVCTLQVYNCKSTAAEQTLSCLGSQVRYYNVLNLQPQDKTC